MQETQNFWDWYTGLFSDADNKVRLAAWAATVTSLSFLITLYNFLRNLFSKTKEQKRPEALEGRKLIAKDFVALCRKIYPYINDNKYVFNSYSPNFPANESPYETDLDLWDHVKKDTIVPNNEVILAIIKQNENLIPGKYAELFDRLKNHIYAFRKHVEDPNIDYSKFQFPQEFESTVKETCFGNSRNNGKLKRVIGWLSKRFNKYYFQSTWLFGSFVFDPNSKRDVDLLTILKAGTDLNRVNKIVMRTEFWFKILFRKKLHVQVFTAPETNEFGEFLNKNDYKIELYG